MRRTLHFLPAFLFGLAAVLVAIAPGVAQSLPSFLESFDGTPAQPTSYTNPSSWEIFVQGFDNREVGSAVQVGQHGPNCEPPGFPYTTSNTHPLRTIADAVFICNAHVMTAPGLTGYGAIYMTPPAVADFSSGSATITWDMSTLRTASRDWVDVVITPWVEHSPMAYNNNDQHIPLHNIHVTLAGTNVFLAYQRINGGPQYGQGNDVLISGDGNTTWDQVFAQHASEQTVDAGRESPSRRDTFEIHLTRTTISVCMPGYQRAQGGVFCWINNNLPQPLDPSVWHDQAAVQFDHRVYNAEKSCIDGQTPPDPNPLDRFSIDHNDFGDRNCPPDTWHWDNVRIQPAAGFPIIQSVPQQLVLNSASPTVVQFAAPAPQGAFLSFVQFGHTPDLRVSFDGGRNWQAPRVQPANAPNNGASEENGEAIFTPMPAGVQQVMVRGSNGFWGSFQAADFTIFGPPNGVPLPTSVPTATSLPATETPVPTPTDAPSPTPTSTSTVVPTDTPAPTVTPTPVAVDTPVSEPTATPVPTDTPTPVPTATDTPTPIPTDVPTPTPAGTTGTCQVTISVKDGTLEVQSVPC